jgi:hypothetical protein
MVAGFQWPVFHWLLAENKFKFKLKFYLFRIEVENNQLLKNIGNENAGVIKSL